MHVRLDEETLKTIADLTRGEYFYAGTAVDLEGAARDRSLVRGPLTPEANYNCSTCGPDRRWRVSSASEAAISEPPNANMSPMAGKITVSHQ